MSEDPAAVGCGNFLSIRSKWVSRPKLLTESGVAGGEGGREGWKASTSLEAFSCDAWVNGGVCGFSGLLSPDSLNKTFLLPNLDLFGEETWAARLRALTAELRLQSVILVGD